MSVFLRVLGMKKCFLIFGVFGMLPFRLHSRSFSYDKVKLVIDGAGYSSEPLDTI